MPNRLIKESIRTSKTINAMTDFQFRAWVYLITYVDDFGRGSADAEILKGFVFPRQKRLRETDIDKMLAELADMGAITLYTVDGDPFFCLPNWGAHQRIQTKKSKFPPPPAESDSDPPESMVTHGESPSSTVDHRDSPPESNPNPNPNPNPKGDEARARARPPTKFEPPGVEEVREYCQSRNSKADPERFVDFYASKGWKVGDQAMKDWKAALRNWEKRDEYARQRTLDKTSKPRALSYMQRPFNENDYDFDDLGKLIEAEQNKSVC